MKKFKPTKNQLRILKEGWKKLGKDQDEFNASIWATEKWMIKESGIKGLEFFHSEFDGYCGIGTEDRKMELLQREELE